MPKEKKNTSKTARVLGLLTSPTEEPQPETPASSEPAAPPQPQPKPTDDAVVEAEVRDALAQELEQALAASPAEPSQAEPQPQPKPEPQPAPEPEPKPQPKPKPEPKPAPQPAAQAEPKPAPKAKPAAAAQPIPTPKNPQSNLEPEIYCFNITQALVEDKVDKYIDLFGLCKCPRCRIDVIALALSNLPPKYVVAKENEMVPLLSVYEGKYSASIISQVMNACKMVMEHPRH